MLDPAAGASKWVRNTSASGESMRAGVQAVTKAPGQSAAEAVDLWYRRVMESRDKWAARVRAVPLESWRDSMLTKGVQRVQQGVASAEGKMAEFNRQFYPWLEQGVRTVSAMPKGSIDDSIARAGAMIRHNHNFRRQG